MLTRRTLLAATAALPFAAHAGDNPAGLIAAIETRSGGRLGVAALDTQTGRRIGHRSSERFAMCSTFKLLLAAAVLHRVDKGEENLERLIAYGKADILPHAPVAQANLAKGGLTVARMAEAVIEDSDNTCANKLIAALGGPSAVTAYARTLGDPVTRLDRTETSLNTAIAGDKRDTTTPDAMLDDLRRLTLGDALSAASRASLTSWLVKCTTAAARIPAGLPAGWKSGNKTGTGENGATNDVAILWPPGRKPMLLAVYFTEARIDLAAREAVIADVARVVSGTLA
ncbi:MAG TPA: class A beta-lactamase [Rhizomicrobium sp.]|jgi:beta-lactamase class A|nr:class A beta-lactamase [Rhizomicrobium sp.]